MGAIGDIGGIGEEEEYKGFPYVWRDPDLILYEEIYLEYFSYGQTFTTEIAVVEARGACPSTEVSWQVYWITYEDSEMGYTVRSTLVPNADLTEDTAPEQAFILNMPAFSWDENYFWLRLECSFLANNYDWRGFEGTMVVIPIISGESLPLTLIHFNGGCYYWEQALSILGIDFSNVYEREP